MKSPARRKGVVLITTVGILSMLTMIAVSFAISALSDYKAAANYRDGLIAKYAAEAGMCLGIAYMRNLAFTSFNATPLDGWRHMSGTLPSGKNCVVYSVDVTDTASQLNVNDTNPNIGTMLENLVAILGSLLQAGDGNAIVTGRPSGGYITKEQLIEYAGFDRTKYEAIKDYITTDSYTDNNSQGSAHGIYVAKSPVNINTASEQVIGAVLTGIVTSDKAQSLASAIIAYRASNPFISWSQFDDFIDTVGTTPSLNSTDIADLKSNANPNRTKPTAFTTEFCFHPSGYYEIESTGLTGIDGNGDGDLNDAQDKINARRKSVSLAKIYGVLNQTTKEQFQGNDGDTVPVAFQVTTFDSCPVEHIDSMHNWEGTGSVDYPASGDYKTVPDSVKNGFWDNFDDVGPSDFFFSNGYWRQANSLSRPDYLYTCLKDKMTITNEEGGTNNKLVGYNDYIGFNVSPIIVLNKASELQFDYLTWRSTSNDGISPYWKNQNSPGYFPAFDGTRVVSHLTLTDCWQKMEQLDLATDTSDARYVSRTAGDFPITLPTGAYHVKNTFITSLPTLTNSYYYAYEQGVNPTKFNLYSSSSAARSNSVGWLGWNMFGAMNTPGQRPSADNVRVIPKDGGYFQSKYFDLTYLNKNVSWGTISAAVTLSTDAAPKKDLYKVYFQLRTDDSAAWLPSFPGVLPGGAMVNPPAGKIQYKANFRSNDIPGFGAEPYLSETIAMEDVTVTYLPRTEILYYRDIP